MATTTNWRDFLPRDWEEEFFDLDADLEECTLANPCEECMVADHDEQRLLARLDSAEMIDLGALAIAASCRPSRVGEEGEKAA